MSFQAYSIYKQSDVEWLGSIPSQWSVLPVKAVATCNNEVLREDTDPEETIRYVEISDVDINEGITGYTEIDFGSAPSRARRRVRDGDILVSTVRTYLKAIALAESPPKNLIASTGFAIIRTNPLAGSNKFLSWLIRSLWFVGEIVSRSVGVSYPAINASDVMNLTVPLPPLTEQQNIVAFLNHETAKIDALVAEQKRLIELLKEKRQAVISHAVTKGLDPDVPMKESGVDWLGEVPAHWELKPLMRLVNESRGIMYGIVLPGPHAPGGVPIVKGGDVKAHRLSLDLLARTTKEIEAGYVRSRLKGGDLVYSIRGGIGDVEVVPDEIGGANLTQDAARISPRDGVNSNWLLNILRSTPVFSQLESGALGATIRGINIFDLKRATIPTPPAFEQQNIADSLNSRIRGMEKLIAQAETGEKLLLERRSALISAAVTGKIDVRDWQPPKPTETTPRTTAEQA